MVQMFILISTCHEGCNANIGLARGEKRSHALSTVYLTQVVPLPREPGGLPQASVPHQRFDRRGRKRLGGGVTWLFACDIALCCR